MQDLDFVAVTKAHADWKVKLRTAIANKEEVDADSLCKDNLCMLGKWLYDENTVNAIGTLPTYEECRVSHARFHEEAGKIAREINRHNYMVAEEMLQSGKPYAQASTDVAMALHDLRKEVQK